MRTNGSSQRWRPTGLEAVLTLRSMHMSDRLPRFWANLMHYARLRAVGLPVGSGVTEGACKSVIKMRTNGSSQRWRPTGLEAVLTLRSMHMSDRLPRFWANFARGYRKEVTLCA